MISLRQIAVVILVAVGLWLLKRLQSRLKDAFFDANSGTNIAKKSGNVSDKDANYHEMVRCVRCGTHLPRAQALGNERRGFYCNNGDCAQNSDAA